MSFFGIFGAGFAAGWVVRSSVDSSRGALVGAIAAVYGVVDRAKRFVAIERENLEDLLAEAKARSVSSYDREVAATRAKTPAAASRPDGQYVQ